MTSRRRRSNERNDYERSHVISVGLVMQGVRLPKFFGREAELVQLQQMFAGVMAGHGALGLVVGEAGIGKTALCRQVASHATAHGGRALLGHCDEARDLSLPYLPFIEAFGTSLRSGEGGSPASGDAVDSHARLPPELRADSARLEPHAGSGDPVSARYRLLRGVVEFLRSVTDVAPHVLVLEDLHNADAGTLDVLRYLSRHLGELRLLVLGTYRESETNAPHPLSPTLAEIQRHGPVVRVALGGLPAAVLLCLAEETTGRALPPGFGEELHQQTEGNPLFVQEVLRHLITDGQLVGTRRGQPISLVAHLPDALREVISAQLTRLGPTSLDVLRTAAVIGRDFSLRTVSTVTDRPLDVVADALEAAVRASVLGEELTAGDVRYRFTHILFRQALYDDLPAASRMRLHARVARALEVAYASDADRHAAELAAHYGLSSEREDLRRAVLYSERAAAHARAVAAFGEAARLFEHALAVQAVVDPDDVGGRCDLVLGLGQACNDAGEARHVLDVVAPEAFALAERLPDDARAARACRLALDALYIEGSSLALGRSEAATWASRLDRLTPTDSTNRVWADVFLGASTFSTIDYWQGGLPFIRRGLERARRLNDPEALWWAAFTWLWYEKTPPALAGQLALARDFSSRSRSGVTTPTLAHALTWMGDQFLWMGKRTEAEGVWRELRSLARRISHPTMVLNLARCDGTLAILDGRLDDSVRLAEQLVQVDEGQEASAYAKTVHFLIAFRSLLHLGRFEEATAIARGAQSVRALSLAHAGRQQEATVLLDLMLATRPEVDVEVDETPLYADVYRLEAAVCVGHRAAAEHLRRRVGASGAVTTGTRSPTSVTRHLAAAAALLDEPREARELYRTALAQMTALRFRPEIALTRLGLAELLLRSFPSARSEASASLAVVRDEFAAMGMRPALAHATALAARCRGPGPTPMVSGAGLPSGLTRREAEVLRLLAVGQSNAEIAESLTVSVRTAERHVANIYVKLGVEGKAARVAAAAFALRQGLVDA